MQQHTVHFREDVYSDLDSIYDYISKKSSFDVADKYTQRIIKLCLSLEYLPNRGSLIPSHIDGLRFIGFERRATILFRVVEREVIILRIFYGGQDIDPILERILAKL